MKGVCSTRALPKGNHTQKQGMMNRHFKPEYCTKVRKFTIVKLIKKMKDPAYQLTLKEQKMLKEHMKKCLRLRPLKCSKGALVA